MTASPPCARPASSATSSTSRTDAMLIEFSDKRVLVIGAAHGIGSEITEQFAARGADVWAGDVLMKEGGSAKTDAGGTIHALRVDATSPESVAKAVASASGAAGAVDVLVYVAGGVLGQTAQPVEAVSLDAWRAILEVN